MIMYILTLVPLENSFDLKYAKYAFSALRIRLMTSRLQSLLLVIVDPRTL